MANRIKCLRKLFHYSQVEFARKFNVEQSAVSNWENDRNKFDLSVASMISKYYQVPMEFVYGEPFEITRPQRMWYKDEIEDMQNAPKECKEYFLFKYGKGVFYKDKEEPNDDAEKDELNEYLEELRNRPDMRMLFSVSKGATKKQVEQAVAIIEALKKTNG